MKNYYVYIHTNKINNKKYIGITNQNPKYRWDYGFGYKKQKVFWTAIKKYGWDAFDHFIFPDMYTEEEAKALEIKLIADYHTCILDKDCQGYNATRGGEGGQKYTTKEEKQQAYINTYKKANKAQYKKIKANKAAYNKVLARNRLEKQLKKTDPEKYEKLKDYNRKDMANRRKDPEYRARQNYLHSQSSKKTTILRNKLKEIYKIHPELFSAEDLECLFARTKNGWKCNSLKKLQSIMARLSVIYNLIELSK